MRKIGITVASVALFFCSCEKDAAIPEPVSTPDGLPLPMNGTVPSNPRLTTFNPRPAPVADYRAPYCGLYQYTSYRTYVNCLMQDPTYDTITAVGSIYPDPVYPLKVIVDFGWTSDRADLFPSGLLYFPFGGTIQIDTTGATFSGAYRAMQTPCVQDDRDIFAFKLP